MVQSELPSAVVSKWKMNADNKMAGMVPLCLWVRLVTSHWPERKIPP